MTTYRAYLLDRAGRIIRAHWLEADDDDSALSAAHELCADDLPMVEVWRGNRRVGAVPCDLKAEA